MTIRHLRIFVMVADCGTMSLAAEKMFLSQPTVSQAIRELEEHYGGLLFERLSKHLYITDLGEKLLGYAREVLRQFDYLEEQMLSKKQMKLLRVGTSMTVGTCLLPDMVQRFKKMQEDVDIFACVNNTKVIEQKLMDGELDVALVEGQVKSPDLVVRPLIEDELVLVCANKHPFAGMKKLYFCQLGNQKFVMREKGSGTRELFEKDLEKHRVKVNVAWEVVGTEAIKHAIIKDNCLSVIAYRLIEKEVRSGEMYLFREDTNRWKRSFDLVYHKDKVINDGMNSFIDCLRFYGSGEGFEGLQIGRLSEG
ncbi:LysR family transcriptional regulator [Robinsoniella peoriensis]